MNTCPRQGTWIFQYDHLTVVGKIYFSLTVTIQGDSCGFGIAEFECDNQIALSPINVKAGMI